MIRPPKFTTAPDTLTAPCIRECLDCEQPFGWTSYRRIRCDNCRKAHRRKGWRDSWRRAHGKQVTA